MNRNITSLSPADAAEQRIDEYEVIIPQNGPAEETNTPRWVPFAMLVLAFAVWLIVAEI